MSFRAHAGIREGARMAANGDEASIFKYVFMCAPIRCLVLLFEYCCDTRQLTQSLEVFRCRELLSRVSTSGLGWLVGSLAAVNNSS
jgi:hypothetical protein